MKKFKYIKEAAWFVGGIVFGTAGIKALTGKTAKRLYVKTLAAGLRAKDDVLNTACRVQENAEDILAEARAENGYVDDEYDIEEIENEAEE